MAQMADPARPTYPPPTDYQGYSQQSPPRHDLPREDSRSSYPPPPPPQDPSRQGQYPPAPSTYQSPGQWAGQPQGQAYQHPSAPNPHYVCGLLLCGIATDQFRINSTRLTIILRRQVSQVSHRCIRTIACLPSIRPIMHHRTNKPSPLPLPGSALPLHASIVGRGR